MPHQRADAARHAVLSARHTSARKYEGLIGTAEPRRAGCSWRACSPGHARFDHLDRGPWLIRRRRVGENRSRKHESRKLPAPARTPIHQVASNPIPTVSRSRRRCRARRGPGPTAAILTRCPRPDPVGGRQRPGPPSPGCRPLFLRFLQEHPEATSQEAALAVAAAASFAGRWHVSWRWLLRGPRKPCVEGSPRGGSAESQATSMFDPAALRPQEPHSVFSGSSGSVYISIGARTTAGSVRSRSTSSETPPQPHSHSSIAPAVEAVKSRRESQGLLAPAPSAGRAAPCQGLEGGVGCRGQAQQLRVPYTGGVVCPGRFVYTEQAPDAF